MSSISTPTPIVFDMETSDPDDVFTLCALATHPWARLVAVTVTPGSNEQVGVVKHVLRRLGVEVPVGAFHAGRPTGSVSEFHTKWLGRVPSPGEFVERDGLRVEVLASDNLRVEQVRLTKPQTVVT